MCGRYYIEVSDAALKEIAEEILRKMAGQAGYQQLALKLEGEIFPTNIVAVQTAPADYQPMRWGFSGFGPGKGRKPSAAHPLINARSETITEKPTFRRPVQESRCLVPASGYYEWQSEGKGKVKYRLYSEGQPLYFAGCYRSESEPLGMLPIPRFVILTQAAAPGIAQIHDRMPVAFTADTANYWLTDGLDALSAALQELEFTKA